MSKEKSEEKNNEKKVVAKKLSQSEFEKKVLEFA